MKGLGARGMLRRTGTRLHRAVVCDRFVQMHSSTGIASNLRVAVVHCSLRTYVHSRAFEIPAHIWRSQAGKLIAKSMRRPAGL